MESNKSQKEKYKKATERIRRLAMLNLGKKDMVIKISYNNISQK